MNAREEQERASDPYPQGELESPFLAEELFSGETEADWEAHLTALEAESPFRLAFEQSPAMPFEPEQLEEEFVAEEERTETEDFLLAENEVFGDELLADLEESIEESDDEESDDEDELRYAVREGMDFSDEELFLDEEAAFSEELLTEVQEGEGSDYWDEVTDVQEAPAFDETFFSKLEEEQGTGAASLRSRIVEVAKQEWEKWGRGSKTETQSEMKDVLRKYWRTVRCEKRAEEAIGKRIPWSAAFISWVMRESNAGDAFKNSSLHTAYIDAAKQAYAARNASRFWAYRITEKKPESGDLVIKDRCSRRERKKCVECFNTNYDNIGDRNNKGYLYRKSHGDIVVSIDHARKRIKVIGGNVDHSVKEKWIDLNPQGYLPERASDGCQYIAILKPPDVERLIPARPSSPGSADLLPTWLSEIVKSGRLTLQAAWAMLTGQRDVNTLTNMIFYARHPDLPVGYKIKPHEKQLAKSWMRIRDEVVIPLVRRLAAGVSTDSSPLSVPAPSPISTGTSAQSSSRIDAVERGRSLGRILDRIRITPNTHILPRTRRVVVDGYERNEPRADVWCQQAGLTLDEGALARMVASEVGTKPPQYMIGVVEATMNEARAKKISAFERITMQGVKLKGGVTPKSAGYFGRQSGRWCASIQDPTLRHLEAVRVVQSAPGPLVARDGRRWVDGKVMDSGRQAGKRLKNNAVTIVEKWGTEGWEWIGPVYGPDGQTLLLDPYRLMVFRLAGRGKADIRRGVEAMREGRRRWKVNVD